jgi:Cys-tRNA(Pro)/Cys-tRNA(Cys) deacylase
MTVTNNVTRLLDSRRISYTAYELPVEKHSALETARLLDVEPDTVFKTMVVSRDKTPSSSKGKKPLLVVIPGPSVVDLKLLASALGEKKVHLPTEREAEQLTGLQAGGISPLALLNKGFQVVIDSSSQKYIAIHISGGQRGLNIKLPVEDLIKLTNARLAAVSKPEEDQ